MALLTVNTKLKAFSIIESIVTMVLILTVFFITVHFLVSLNQSGYNTQRLKARSALDSYIRSAFAQKEFSNNSTIQDGWPVATISNRYKETEDMIQVSFIVYKKDNSGQQFIHREFLVLISPTHE